MADSSEIPSTESNSSSSPIPVISLSAFASPEKFTDEDRACAANALVEACRTVGFVYLTDHGVPKDAVSRAFEQAKQFFDLSQEMKALAPHPDGWAVHRGYSRPGLEKVSNAIAGPNIEQQENNHDCSRKDGIVKDLRTIPDFKES